MKTLQQILVTPNNLSLATELKVYKLWLWLWLWLSLELVMMCPSFIHLRVSFQLWLSLHFKLMYLVIMSAYITQSIKHNATKQSNSYRSVVSGRVILPVMSQFQWTKSGKECVWSALVQNPGREVLDTKCVVRQVFHYKLHKKWLFMHTEWK